MPTRAESLHSSTHRPRHLEHRLYAVRDRRKRQDEKDWHLANATAGDGHEPDPETEERSCQYGVHDDCEGAAANKVRLVRGVISGRGEPEIIPTQGLGARQSYCGLEGLLGGHGRG